MNSAGFLLREKKTSMRNTKNAKKEMMDYRIAKVQCQIRSKDISPIRMNLTEVKLKNKIR